MRSVFFLSLILGKKIRNAEYKTFSLLIILIGFINVASAYQCYNCSSTLKASCGDPFDATSMTDADKVPLPPGRACVVCFMRNDSCFYINNSL
jgi:hypothetical protein